MLQSKAMAIFRIHVPNFILFWTVNLAKTSKRRLMKTFNFLEPRKPQTTITRNPQRSEQSNDLTIISALHNKMFNWKLKKCTIRCISTPALRISRRLTLKFRKINNIPITAGLLSIVTEGEVRFYWFRQTLPVSPAYSAGFVPESSQSVPYQKTPNNPG